MEYPNRDAALLAHAEALGVSCEQAAEALLNQGMLESALARPRNSAAYEDADVVRQAASLFWGIASSHAFRDGNKRTAVVLLRAFLNVNGFELELSEDDRFSLALGVADERWSVERVDAVLRPAVHPVPPD